MFHEKSIPNASELVAKSALNASIQVNLFVYILMSFAVLFTLFSFQYYRIYNAFESNVQSLVQSIKLGDMFTLSTQIESIFSTGNIVAIKLVENTSQMILREKIKIPKACMPTRNLFAIDIVFCDYRIFLVSRYSVSANHEKPVGTIVALSVFPTKIFVVLLTGLLIAFLFSLIVLTNRFKKIGLNISAPIAEFSRALQDQNPEKLSVNVPENFHFLEMWDLYSRYAILVEKINGSRMIEKDAAIGRITAHLSHDLRAPLGTFERLLQAPDEMLPSMRGAVRDSLNRMHSMIEALRHSELENLIVKSNAKISLNFGRESLQNKADERHILLSIPENDLGEVWLDPLKIERSWLNLVSNAIEAAKTSVIVETEKIETSLYIRVIDDGQGVSDIILPKLFQRGLTFGKAGGTGLGLAYVRQIMQGHGGDVTYMRQNGLSIFECFIPNAVGQKAALKDEYRSIEKKGASVKQVSICFDRPGFGDTVCKLLNDIGDPHFAFKPSYCNDSAILITNDEDLSLKALESGKETIEIKKNISEQQLVDRLKGRLNLTS